MLRISPGFESKIHNWAKKCQKSVKKCKKVKESEKKRNY